MNKILRFDLPILGAIFATITIMFLIIGNFASEKWVEAKLQVATVHMKIFEKRLERIQKTVDNNNIILQKLKAYLNIKQRRN